MPPRLRVAVDVTNLWASPSSPRDIDAAMLGDAPDIAGWLARLDADEATSGGRLGLHDRLLTQVSLGEPVEVVGPARDGLVPVTCPWQPFGVASSAVSPDGGYPGWLVAAHLCDDVGADRPGPSLPGWGSTLLEAAGAYLGVPYLWGGCCRVAVDCSSLVHLAARELGLVVPRDAADQHDACRPVALDRARPGDLLFFAHPGRRPHHVAIVSAPGRILHAPETGAVVVDEELGQDRLATLVAAGALVAVGEAATPGTGRPVA